MPTPKLFTRQYQSLDGRTFVFHRYWDNHNNNYEYQVYELVTAKETARLFGAPDHNNQGNNLNSRQMCDWVWENIEPFEGIYRQGNDH